MKLHYVQCTQFQFVAMVGKLDEQFFRPLSKYFLGRDVSAPLAKLAYTPMPLLSPLTIVRV